MRVYLCAPFSRQAAMRTYRRLLEREGVTVIARWLDLPAAEPASLADQALIAHICLEDIQQVDALVAFTELPDSGYWTGGRHVEFGAAWAWGRLVYVVGPVENVFHALPQVTRCRDIAELLVHLGCDRDGRPAIRADIPRATAMTRSEDQAELAQHPV